MLSSSSKSWWFISLIKIINCESCFRLPKLLYTLLRVSLYTLTTTTAPPPASSQAFFRLLLRIGTICLFFFFRLFTKNMLETWWHDFSVLLRWKGTCFLFPYLNIYNIYCWFSFVLSVTKLRWIDKNDTCWCDFVFFLSLVLICFFVSYNL